MNYFVIPGMIRPDNMRKEYGLRKPNAIIAAVLAHFEITYDQLILKSQKAEIVYRRQVLIYLLYKHTMMSCIKIGKLTGKDRTTIPHCVKHLKDLIETDPEIREEIENLQENI